MNGEGSIRRLESLRASRPCSGRIASFLVPCSLALLGACARPDAPRPGAGTDVSPGSLVGTWVLEGDSCESDNGVFYRPDGGWHADGAAGTWGVASDMLTIVVTEEEDDRGQMKRLDPPSRHVERLEILGPGAYAAHREDGSTRRFVRCPA